MSVRKLQELCRKGEIPGAIKCGGVWFIPDESVRPSAEHGSHLRFTGTKQKIFETAADLFSKQAYESVTIKDISKQVGIGQSAVYNHFRSKQEILDAIYDYFEHYYVVDWPASDEIDRILRDGSLLDILNRLSGKHKKEHLVLLISCTRIIFQRAFIDDRARSLFRSVMLQGSIDFVTSLFDRAVEMGRLAPFDTKAMSVMFNMNRWYGLLDQMTHPNPKQIFEPDLVYFANIENIQKKLSEYMIANLTDLRDEGAKKEEQNID